MNDWVLDKRIPLALILAILLQTGGALWWAASISQRVLVLEQSRLTAGDLPGRIIKVETQLESVNSTVQRVEDKLDRVLERRP